MGRGEIPGCIWYPRGVEAPVWAGTIVAAFLSSVLSGVAGFGGAMVFLPFLVAAHGVRPSVPILTICVLMANLARVWFNRRELKLGIAARFYLGSIPFAVLGSMLYVQLPPFWIKKGIGAFLVAIVLYQRLHRPVRVKNPWVFAPLGAVSGFFSALVGGIGPLSAPFFLAYGLAKEAFVGTEALCAAGMHVAKAVTYWRLSVLGGPELAAGVAYGLVMVAGSYAATKVLEKISRQTFQVLVEALLVFIGLYMLVQK